MPKIKIELTEEQQIWLLRFLNREWDAEVDYQWYNRESDTSYLEDMLDVYTALLGKTNSIIMALVISDDIESKQNDINSLKNSNKYERIKGWKEKN